MRKSLTFASAFKKQDNKGNNYDKSRFNQRNSW